MKRIIVISGKQYSGKDTLAEILLKKLPNFKRIGIGDAIKLEYSRQKSIPLEEIIKNKHLYRNDLIALGNRGRAQDSDYWLKVINNMDNIIVPDIRVVHEAEFFLQKGAYLIRVNSDYKNRASRGVITNNDDITETALDNYNKWNIVIENNSDLEALTKRADFVIGSFMKFIN